MVDVTAIANPSNLDEITGKTFDDGTDVSAMLHPDNQIELTNNSPIATAATNSSPFGFATGDQADDLIATVREIRAGLITLGLFKDGTANAD